MKPYLAPLRPLFGRPNTVVVRQWRLVRGPAEGMSRGCRHIQVESTRTIANSASASRSHKHPYRLLPDSRKICESERVDFPQSHREICVRDGDSALSAIGAGARLDCEPVSGCRPQDRATKSKKRDKPGSDRANRSISRSLRHNVGVLSLHGDHRDRLQQSPFVRLLSSLRLGCRPSVALRPLAFASQRRFVGEKNSVECGRYRVRRSDGKPPNFLRRKHRECIIAELMNPLRFNDSTKTSPARIADPKVNPLRFFRRRMYAGRSLSRVSPAGIKPRAARPVFRPFSEKR